MTEILVSEVAPDSEHLCYHKFEISEYREIMSFNGFFNSVKRRNWPKGGKLYHAQHLDEFERSMKITRKSLPGYGDDIPRMKHDSIWDFYKFIGYDYKRKKYI